MAQETIVFTQGIGLPPDVQELARTLKPPQFELNHLPADASPEDIAAAMRDAEYLMGFIRYLPDEAFLQASRLQLVQVLSAGYDRVNIAGARKARIPICTNGGANSVAVAEHAIMLILAVFRKLVAYHQNVAAGRWNEGIPRTVDIYELEGKTVGLIGLGNIGQQVARRLKAFDADILYYDEIRQSPEVEERLGARFVPLETLLETGLRQDREAVLRHAVRANIRASANHLRQGSQLLEHLIQTDGLVVVGAEYSLETGTVDFFDGVPA